MSDTSSMAADTAWIMTEDFPIPPYYVGIDSIVLPYRTGTANTDSNGVDFYVDETSLTAYPVILATDVGNASTSWAYAVFTTGLTGLVRHDHFQLRARVWSNSDELFVILGEPIVYWKVGS